jgi:hypothetical protein
MRKGVNYYKKTEVNPSKVISVNFILALVLRL